MRKQLILIAQYLIIALAITACTPQHRLTHMMRKHPELFRADTITIRDTIRLKADKADTVFSYSSVTDTVVLKEGRLTVKYYHTRDSIYLKGECKDSIIVREIRAACPPVPTSRAYSGPWVNAFVGLLFLIIVAAMLYGLTRKRKPP
jgi:hypothetical protein